MRNVNATGANVIATANTGCLLQMKAGAELYGKGQKAYHVMEILDMGEASISVSMEEVEAGDWAELVYKPEIANKPKQLYKQPGYNLSDLP